MGDNTCIYCGEVTPEGALCCGLCSLKEIKKSELVGDISDTLKTLDYGFANVKGVSVYKTINNMYKVNGYKEGIDCLSLEDATSVIADIVVSKKV